MGRKPTKERTAAVSNMGPSTRCPLGLGRSNTMRGMSCSAQASITRIKRREEGVAPDPNILHVKEHHVEIGKLGGGGFFVRAVQGMHGQCPCWGLCHPERGSPSGKVAPESVFGTKSSRDVDAQPHQGVHKVGRGRLASESPRCGCTRCPRAGLLSRGRYSSKRASPGVTWPVERQGTYPQEDGEECNGTHGGKVTRPLPCIACPSPPEMPFGSSQGA